MATSQSDILYVSCLTSDDVLVINGSTSSVATSIAVGQGPEGVAYDNSTGEIYVADSGSVVPGRLVSVIDSRTDRVTENLTVGFSPWGVSYDYKNGNIYVANSGSKNVSVISGAKDKVIANITVGFSPERIALDLANNFLYVTDSGSNAVSIIDPTQERAVASILVGQQPSGIAYDASNGDIYVVDEGSSELSVINGTRVIGNVTLGILPFDVAYDYRSQELFVTQLNVTESNVTVISGITDRVMNVIRAGAWAEGILYDSVTDHVFVANGNSNNITVIDGATDDVVGGIPTSANPTGIAFSEPNQELLVTESSVPALPGKLAFISTTNNTLTQTRTTGLGPSNVLYDNSNGNVYIADEGGNAVTVLNATNGSFVATVPVMGGPYALAYDEADQMAYVTDYYAGKVTVLNMTENVVVRNISLGQVNPSGILFDRGDGYFYVADTNTNYTTQYNVSVIDPSAGKPTYNITVGTDPEYLALNLMRDSLYVTQFSTGQVTVVNFSVGRETSSIGVGSGPEEIAFDPVNGLVYVANTLSGNVTIINATTDVVVGQVVTGLGPYGVVVNPKNGYAYVTDEGSSAVSVLSSGIPLQISSFRATPPDITLGQTSNLTVVATGGDGWYAYAYSGLPPGCVPSNEQALSCTPTASGNYSVSVTVVDTHGGSQNATLSLLVEAPRTASLSSVSVTPPSVTFRAGSSVVLIALPMCTGGGGQCPSNGMTFAWSVSNQLGYLNSTLGKSARFWAGSKTGKVTITVAATLDGVSKWANATVTITSTPSSSAFLGLSWNDGYILVGVVIATVAAAAVILLLRKRAPPKPTTPSSKEPEEEKAPEKTEGKEEPSPDKKE